MSKQKLLDNLKVKELLDENLPFKKEAHNLVFGEGSADAEILFLGEAPGKQEDLTGRPFIGSAGKVLDLLLNSINLSRENVFITSVLHYRPPNNRQPKPDEIKAYSFYIDEMIKIINPKIIATLGNHSLGKFLPKAKISSIHGTLQTIIWAGQKIQLLPLYHPAAVLYRPQLKNILLEDIKIISKSLKEK